MDILALNELQRLNDRQNFNQFFEREPVFGYWSTSSSYAGMMDYYGDRDTIPMQTFSRGQAYPGQPVSMMLQSATEKATANANYWGGNANSEASSNSYTPNSGYVGLGGQNQLMTMHGVDYNTEGEVHSDCRWQAATMNATGVVLGENAEYRQGINLMKNGGNIHVDYADVRNAVDSGLLNYTPWTNLPGLTRLASGRSAGAGDIAYNRKTGTLAFMETDASGNCRLHIFKNLPEKLTASAARLRVLLEDAIAGRNGSSYETFSFTWSGSSGSEWLDGTVIVPCDDNTFWLVRMLPSSKLELSRVYFSSGTTRAFAVVDSSLSLTTSYGREQGSYYGLRHMVSQDEKFVAAYCPYYYYLCGGAFFFVPRDSAQTPSRYRKMLYGSSGHGCTIAPQGGSNFVVGRCSNNDGKVVEGSVVDLERSPLDGSSVSPGFNQILVSAYATSTMYGGNGFLKIHPSRARMTEWQERAA